MSAYPSITKDAVINLYNAGYKVNDIAEKTNIHFTTIYGWLRKNGVQLRTVPNWSKYRSVARQRNLAYVKLAKLQGLI